ncbi:uncharacterized protein LOC141801667 isoform X2 [Halichoeres trimaculatus]
MDQEDTEYPHIEEKLWNGKGPGEANTTKLLFTSLPVKSDDDEEKPQSSQSCKGQTEQIKTENDEENCTGPEPHRGLDAEKTMQPDSKATSRDCSEPDTDDSEDWKETGGHHSGSISEINVTDDKPYGCSDCGKSFKFRRNLKGHMRIHTGEKPYRCRTCGKTFSWHNQLNRHKCDDVDPLILLHYQPAEKIETESRTNEEDCGGVELVKTIGLERHSLQMTGVKTEDPDLEKTTENQSDLNSIENCKNKSSNRLHKCTFCGKTFEFKRYLTQHMKGHIRGRPFLCSVCGKSFGQKSYLIKHMSEHSGEKPFSCSECGKRFTRNSGLICHMALHRGEKPYSCSVCGKRFTQKGHVISHMLIHSGKKPFGCSECSKSFTHKYYLNLHMARHKGEKPLICCVCDQRFSWHSQIQGHKCSGGETLEFNQNQNMKTKKAEGQDCSKPDREDWKKTKEHNSGTNYGINITDQKPETDLKPYSCFDCGKLFKFKRNLKGHMRIHTGEKPYRCLTCGKTFSWHNQLNRHKCDDVDPLALLHYQPAEKIETESRTDVEDCGGVELVKTIGLERHSLPKTGVKTEDPDLEKTTENQSDLNFKENCERSSNRLHECTFCGKTFEFKQYLTQHMKNHTGEKPFICSECGKSFRQKHHLIQHMSVHTGEKLFSCFECGQRFTRKSGLTCHMLIHKGEKPHSCSVCGKRFSQRSHLVSHMLVHSGKRPFGCSECSQRFTTEHNLTLHMAWHKTEKPLSCPVCDRRFSWHLELQSHRCLSDKSLELNQNQTKETRGAKSQDSSEPECDEENPLLSQSSEKQIKQIKTEDDEENCEGPEPDRRSDARETIPHTKATTKDCSEPDTDDSEDWNREIELVKTIGPERHSLQKTGVKTEDPDLEKTTENQSDLNSIENCKNKSSNRLHKCTFCGKTFEFKRYLTQHMKGHIRGRPFLCSVCGKSFGQKSYLIKHMSEHSGEKPFSCSECGKRFTRNSGLICHMALHRGEKPYSCSVCGKRFTQKGHVISHMLIHSGKKPFGCSECSKSFTHKYYLNLHMARHKGEKPLICCVCDQRFSWHSQMQGHKCSGGDTLKFNQI